MTRTPFVQGVVAWALVAACGSPSRARPDRLIEVAPASSHAAPSPEASHAPNATTEAATTGSDPVQVRAELPPWAAFTRAANDGDWGAPAPASQRLWLESDRAVAAVRTQRPSEQGTSWRVSLVRLRKAGQAWAPDGVRTLQTWSELPQLARDGTIAVFLLVSDLEQDGELEILARYKLAYVCCPMGETRKRSLVISNDDATLSESAYLELDEATYRTTLLGKERFTDVNGDGHADLVITQKFSFEDEAAKSSEELHLWQAPKDRFESALRPTGDDCHCE